MDGGYIRELCLALEHRWEPELPFLLFTAYFDESDTHGPAPTLIMAAFLGSVRQWELFGRRIKGIQRRNGFKVFHAKDFRALRGEFQGWSAHKCADLINDIAVAIRDNLKEGVTIVLPSALYETEYRGGIVPKGARLDSQYGVCFRICLLQLIKIFIEDKKRHKLHIVIESGHKNVGDACRIFEEVKREYADLGLTILGDITVAQKSERMELMIADFQAHASHLSETRLKAGLPDYFELAAERAGGAHPPRGQAALTKIEHTPELLRAARQADIGRWQAARKARRARRSARSFSASDDGQPS